MDSYAIVAGDECLNVVLWDGVMPYEPPPGCELVLLVDDVVVGPGWRRVDGVWQSPLPSGSEE